VLWSAGGVIQDLGTLPGGASSRALGINDRSQVVGTSESSAGSHAFLWTPGNGMQDLNDLLTSRTGFVLTQAVAISPRGIIAAIGQDEIADAEPGHGHGDHELPTRIFLLVPVP
jgi:probable HAF family extracellular repeat protein